MKHTPLTAALLACLVFHAGCTPAPESAESAPVVAADPADVPAVAEDVIFPADRSLRRPEDGVQLADGRLLVSDQAHGLVLLAGDGTSRPFAALVEAGYPAPDSGRPAAANGVTLEPDGVHVLVTDIYGGGIYRVDTANETSEQIHQHAFGVNMARADRAGGLWFTQSARNPAEDGEARLWSNVASGEAEGAVLYRAAAPAGAPAGEAVVVADGLQFANGIALDEEAGYVYVAETTGGRVLRYRFEAGTGALSDRTVVLDGVLSDNLELDARGRLWIALPLATEIIMLDTASGSVTSMWRVDTPESKAARAGIQERMAQGQPWLDLMAPPLWSPAPGAATGMILSPEGELLYVTNLGDALVRIGR